MEMDIEELMRSFEGTRIEAEELQQRLALQLRCSQDDPRLRVFTVVRNAAINLHALISFYNSYLSGEIPIQNPETISKFLSTDALKRRINQDAKLMFIEALSAAEYSIKTTLRDKENYPIIRIVLKNAKRSGHLCLESIVDASFKNDIIPDDEYADWNALFDIRYCLIYNNEIADKPYVFDISGPKIKLKQGQKIAMPDYRYIDLSIITYSVHANLLRALYGLPHPGRTL